jgi:type IV secretory pathway protease TraF
LRNAQTEAAEQAVDSLLQKPALPSLRARFSDPARWRKSLTDLALWFAFGGLITTMLGMYSPGYPIVVGTTSITPGVYWLDRQAFSYSTNDFVTFPFMPAQPWLHERYGDGRIFTKIVKGVPGDTIYADTQLRLKVCHKSSVGDAPVCEDIGVAQTQDSLGRPLTPWVPAGHQYTLADGELWVYAPNVKSFDSRYYGPVRSDSVSGKAKPLFYWY